jgi:carbon-monoxide dehydrogenase large subunit
MVAAERLRNAGTAAAERAGCAKDDVTIDDTEVVGPGRAALPLSDFTGLSAEGVFASSKRTYSYGAHAAMSRSSKTGRVRLIDYVAVEDVVASSTRDTPANVSAPS